MRRVVSSPRSNANAEKRSSGPGPALPVRGARC